MHHDLEQAKPASVPFSPLLGFFIFCSAADKNVLSRCPASEHNKYASIGATVFFTGVLASLSGGYALYTVFNNVWIATALGLFWGVLVFNLDRFIVSTIKKSEPKYGQLRQVIPRLMLAVFLAIVISKPLELKIFEQEIGERMYYSGLNKMEQLDILFEEKISNQQKGIQRLQAQTEERRMQVASYYEQYKCECEGTCGTGEKGFGSECKRKQLKYEEEQQDYLEIKKENDNLATGILLDIKQLKADRAKHKSELKSSFATGLMARLEALGDLPSGPSWAIVMLLICIEIAPIFAKLLSPFGPYDHLLKSIEYDYEIEEISSISMRNQKLNNHLTLVASVEQEKIDQQIMNNKETLHLIDKAQQELVKEQLDIWVEKEKAKLRENADQYT
jgi:Domain of unknown function (DUF4407)